MTHLSENWITEKHIDFEYKKYLLLAWLQKVEAEFRSIHLYPTLGELLTHYRNAFQLRHNKISMEAKFPQVLRGIKHEHMELDFDPVMKDDHLMAEIERILDFSIPKFEEWLKEGKCIYELLEEDIEISPVGIMPLHTEEGYLFLSQGKQDTRVYSFQLTIYDDPSSKWRALHTAHIADWKRNFTNTPESIKSELIRSFSTMPNPAVYVATSAREIPVEETFLPIAKRMLIRTISVP